MPAGTSFAQLIISIRAIDQATGPMRAVQGQAAGLAGVLGTGATVAAAAAATAMAGAGVAALKMGMDFEKGMSEVRTLMPTLSEEGFKTLENDVLSLSKEIGIATDQVVPALYQAISAGVPSENVIDFMTIGAKAAIGGCTDLKTAVDGLTTVVNAFGMSSDETGRAADVMFTAVRLGKTTFGELSEAMYIAAPLAAAMGVEFEELAAAATTLTKQGMPTQIAMMGVRSALVALQRTTPEMEAALQSLGYATGQAALDALGFQGVMVALRTEAERTGVPLIEMMGRVEGVQAALGLTGEQAANAAADLEEMTNAIGANDAAFAVMEETASHQLQVALNELRVTLTEIGLDLLPYLTTGVEGTTTAIHGMASAARLLTSMAKENKEVLLLLATALSARLALAAVRAARDFLMLMNAFTTVRVAGIAMSTSLLGPLGLIAGLTAAAAAVVIFRNQLGLTETDILGVEARVRGFAEALQELGYEAARRGEDPQIAQLRALAQQYDDARAAAERYHDEGLKGQVVAGTLVEYMKGLKEVAGEYTVTYKELLAEVIRGNISMEAASQLFPEFQAEILKMGKAAMEAAAGVKETGDAAEEATAEVDKLAEAVQNLQSNVDRMTLGELDLQLQINQMERMKEIMGDAFGSENQARLDALNARMEELGRIDEEVMLRFRHLQLSIEEALGPEQAAHLSDLLQQTLASLPDEKKLQILLILDQLSLSTVENVVSALAKTRISIPVLLTFEVARGVSDITRQMSEAASGAAPVAEAVRNVFDTMHEISRAAAAPTSIADIMDETAKAASAATSSLGAAGSAAGGAADELSEAEQALVALVRAFTHSGMSAEQYQRRLALLQEAMDRFEISADDLYGALRRSGLGAEQFARQLQAVVELEQLRDQANEARSAIDDLYNSFSNLFVRPTKEAAQIRLQLALEKERRAKAVAEGADEEYIAGLDRIIDNIQQELNVRQAHQDVLRAELDMANRALATDAEQESMAKALITQMGLASAGADVLQEQLYLSAVALSGWTRQMEAWMGAASSFQQWMHGQGVPGFQHGGVMPYTGLAWLERGERVLSPQEAGGIEINSWGPFQVVLPNVRKSDDIVADLDRQLRNR